MSCAKDCQLCVNTQGKTSLFLSVALQGNKLYICFTEEDDDEIKIGTSCKNGGCTKVCLCTNCISS